MARPLVHTEQGVAEQVCAIGANQVRVSGMSFRSLPETDW